MSSETSCSVSKQGQRCIIKRFKKCIPSYSVSPLSIIHSKESRTQLGAHQYKSSESFVCQRHQDPWGCLQNTTFGAQAAVPLGLCLLYVTQVWLLSEFTRNMNKHMKTISQNPCKMGSCVSNLVSKKKRFTWFHVPASPSTAPSNLPAHR